MPQLASVSAAYSTASSWEMQQGAAVSVRAANSTSASLKDTEEANSPEQKGDQNDNGTTKSAESKSLDTKDASGRALSKEEQSQLNELKKRDRVVRDHEAAHMAAASGLAVSGINFSMQTGPDGKRYAVGGEVKIDLSPGRTPEETIRKARIIQAAATAPADPSAQDRNVAAQARVMEQQAEQEIAQRNRQQQKLASHYQSDSLPRNTFQAQA